MIGKIKENLESREFKVMALWGLGFDLIARRRDTYLIKVSENINSLKAEVAYKIRKIAGFLRSFALVIGRKRGDEPLLDNVVYHRHCIPAFNERTFFGMLDGDMPTEVSEKGGIVVRFDAARLGSQDVREVAQKVGVSERCAFYYLRGGIASVKKERAEKLRENFGEVFRPYELERVGLREDVQKPGFVQKLEEMGFENTSVGTRACDILSRLQEFGLASKVGNSEWSLRYHIDNMKSISTALEVKPLFILRTRRKVRKEIKDVPMVSTGAINSSDAEEFLDMVEA